MILPARPKKETMHRKLFNPLGLKRRSARSPANFAALLDLRVGIGLDAGAGHGASLQELDEALKDH